MQNNLTFLTLHWFFAGQRGGGMAQVAQYGKLRQWFWCQCRCVRKKNFSETIFCRTSHSFQYFNNLGSMCTWECTSNINLFRLESVSQRQCYNICVIRPYSCRNSVILADFNNLKQNYIIVCFNFSHFLNFIVSFFMTY